MVSPTTNSTATRIARPLVAAGGCGHACMINPIVLVHEIRDVFDGTILLALYQQWDVGELMWIYWGRVSSSAISMCT